MTRVAHFANNGANMSDDTRVSLRVEDDIAFIEIDCPGKRVNTLSAALIDDMEEILDELQQKSGIVGAVVHSAKDDFIVGFDIEEFSDYADDPGKMREVARRGHNLMNRFEALGFPFVAAIHGNCLGGGLEVALACHARIASDSDRTQLGFPEVQLGLFPGGGGTQRLPRLIDLQIALNMILTAKNQPAKKARKIGLVDDVVHHGILLDVAADKARELYEKHGGREENDFFDNLLHDPMKAVAQTPARAIVFNRARDMVQKQTGGHYPAPFKAIECIEIGLKEGFQAGIEAEIEKFAEMVQTQESKNLREIFFMKQEADKDPVVSEDVAPADVRKVGVLGAGLMGAGIAQSLAYNEYNVRLKDKDAEGLGWGLNYCHDLFQKAVKHHKMSEPMADVAFGRIAGTTGYEGFSNCGLVIEAVFEDRDLKQRILADVEALGNDELIFASNTSTIPIGEIAADAEHPENVIGMHFFSPVYKMPLLEIIKTDATSDRAVATALEVGRAMGKTPIVVNDGPGFFTSRVIGAYINEAGWILQEGAAIEDIDYAMRQWGFPVGPMKLIDEVGIDVALKAAKTLQDAFDERWDAPTTVRAIAEDGRKGKKNDSGLYIYEDGKSKGPDPTVYDLIGGGRDRRKVSERMVQDRCWLAMLNECAYCLQEGIAERPRDIDIGVVFGLGFPPFRGGVLHHADNVGLGTIVDTMNRLADEYGDRLRPAQILIDKADAGETFFGERG
jgi:3-hydroxyacyl-CoA dehydrogenase/enoyl-CoA hydratase/3-hydroxybutyryl-CoA epimerase